ncbi:MAG: PAS domain-containing sensor histidine kinase, partial [Pseudaminobacter sp.]|nr:PAS domain-containing sensor histidine kinase [Pseudaminobacter sp.]
MASASYSFIDVAILDAVRERFASGDALTILTADLDQVIWANGPGAQLFGRADIEEIIGEPSGLGFAAKRQIMATSGYPHIGRDRGVMVRLTVGMTSRAVAFTASALTLPDGEDAILLALPASQSGAGRAADIAARAISGFNEPGHFVAFIDGQGAVEAASLGFENLGIQAETLAGLAAEIGGQSDRIVKRIIQGGSARLPAGLARLVDDPPRHLLVVIDERPTGEENIEPPELEALVGADEPERMPAAPPAPSIEQDNSADLTAGDGSQAEPASGDAKAPAKEAGEPPAHHDNWYFNAAEEALQGREQEPDATPKATELRAKPAPSEVDRTAAPVRFVWRTDADGKFSAISQEFANAVGALAADLVGRRFDDVADTFGLDPSGEIAGLLDRRDTWSGRSVLWPVAGTDLWIPVDLAALPVYGRDRNFEGFRGFGVARSADAVADPEHVGRALVTPASETTTPVEDAAPAAETPSTPKEEPAQDVRPIDEDPFKGEVPALTIVPKPDRRFSDKVIRLAEHRQPVAEKAGLSSVERNAFREIGEKLKKIGDIAPASPPSGVAPDAAEMEPSPGPALPPAVEATEAEAAGDVTSSAADIAREPEAESVEAAAPADKPATSHEPATEPAEEDARPEAGLDRVQGADELAADEGVEPGDEGGSGGSTGEDRKIEEALPVREPLPAAISEHASEAAKAAADTSILARLPVPLLIHSGDLLHYANDEFLALTGYASVEAMAEAGGLGALFSDPYGGDSADGPDRSLRLRTGDGLEFPIDALLRSVPWNGGKALMLVVRRTG